ncbi:FKBP-type peptidyl-prolyl cis-trans isomerase SlyD [hydrothermal vent metagenome]|uniref:peptidylprolyl isomerase n=1 Tax=hydrothermal vent metagenome TaxID=652676 RepID=A0A3B0RBN3_9ZZZZ
MSQVKEGSAVKVHYTGKLSDGSVFDTSRDGTPLDFKVGDGMVIKGFETAIIGMKAGDTKTVTLAVEDAYGPKRDELLAEVEREKLPQTETLEVGKTLEVQQPDGQSFMVKVVGLTETMVSLDANHPLAGQDLTFDIELLELT